MSVVTPEIRFFADCHWLMADNIILLRITPMLPYEWSNLRRLFDCKSTFETRSGPFDYWRIRLEFDGNLIHWTVSDGWWHPKTTTFDTDYETTGGSEVGKQVSINDKSGASANIDIQVNYSLRPNAAVSLYRDYGSQENFVSKYISNDLRSVTREIAGKYDTITMLTDRGSFTRGV